MAHFVIFPNINEFLIAKEIVRLRKLNHTIVDPPEFCHGLIAPAIEVLGGIKVFTEILHQEGVHISGTIPQKPHKKELPAAPPPENVFKDILGPLTLHSVIPSATDSLKFDAYMTFTENIAQLIPLLPRLLKGGTFNPGSPYFTFDEEHRLICVAQDSLFLSRIDDLQDLWIMLRSSVELCISAWKQKSTLKPETEPRYAIGALEIYRRLPGTDCGVCGSPTCMEFAVQVFMKKSEIAFCKPLFEIPHAEMRKSMISILKMIGINY